MSINVDSTCYTLNSGSVVVFISIHNNAANAKSQSMSECANEYTNNYTAL